ALHLLDSPHCLPPLSVASSFSPLLSFFFFFNDTATTEIYTLSLHDALPICRGRSTRRCGASPRCASRATRCRSRRRSCGGCCGRSEEHTSELQSLTNLVCRLLLEKKKKNKTPAAIHTAKDTTLVCNSSRAEH